MPLINVILLLIVVGVVLWLLQYIPMDAKILQIIRGLVIICVVLWLISLFVPGLASIRVGAPYK
jgi:uncharacterized membrane protein YwzB